MTRLDTAAVRAIARELAGVLQRAVADVERRLNARFADVGRIQQGVITAVNAGPPPTIDVDLGGDADATAIRYMNGYSPSVGHAVWLIRVGPDLFALGRLAP